LDFLEGQSDGSGEDDVSPIGSGSERGLRPPYTDQRGPSDRPVQQDVDYASTTLWSNSSRYFHHSLSLSLSKIHPHVFFIYSLLHGTLA
jgi:hypothetical protein